MKIPSIRHFVLTLCALLPLATGATAQAQQKTVAIAAVNNPDMIELKKLSAKFEEKNPGLKMPEQPTWDDIKKFADALSDKSKGVYGITLRGKPGWGENMAIISTMINPFGATYFDMNWNATIDSPEWKKAVSFYLDLMRKYGPPMDSMRI